MAKPRRRGKRSWQVQIELPPDPITGDRRRRWLTVRGTLKDAERAQTKEQYEIDHGVDVPPDRITVDGLLESWMRDQVEGSGVEPSTVDRYRQTVRRVSEHLGTVKLQGLRPAHVQRCYAQLVAGGLAPSTAAVDATILNMALTWAVRMQLVVVNPAAAASAPRAERSELLALDADGVASLLDACGDEELRRIIYVAVHTALRISEIMGLRWSDVDLDGRRAAIVRAVKYIDGEYLLRVPKSEHSRRSVALSQETVEALKQQRRWQLEARLQAGGAYVDGDLVFAGALGEVKSLGAVRSAFKRLVKRIGQPDLRFHSLRHTSATLALKAGVHPRIVSERLGHSRIDITMRVYSHVLPDMQRDAADALDAMLPALKDTGTEGDRRQSGGN